MILGALALEFPFRYLFLEGKGVAVSRVVRNTGPGLHYHLPFAVFRGCGLPSQSLGLLVQAGETCLLSGSTLGRCGQAWEMCLTELRVAHPPPVASEARKQRALGKFVLSELEKTL